jgi:hypothetical protein
MTLLMGGAMMSLMGGLASVFLAQALRQTVVGSHHLQMVTGATPLVAIPHIRAPIERGHPLQRIVALFEPLSRKPART